MNDNENQEPILIGIKEAAKVIGVRKKHTFRYVGN